MYAVFQSGGKQHRVVEGQTLLLEKLNVEVGSNVNFDKVLLLSDGKKMDVGSPTLNGINVTGQVIKHGKKAKIHVVKYRRRKHSGSRNGHRQNFTQVKIVSINSN